MANSQSQTSWEDLLDDLPDSEHEILDSVGRLREQGALESASRRLAQAIERNATPRLRRVMGRVEISRENFVRAGEVVEPLCRRDEPDPDALIIYARTQGARGDLDEALLTLQKARNAGAHPEEIARTCREVEGLPDPTDEEPLDADSNLRHESEPTLDVGEKWQDLVQSADSAEELRRRSRDSTSNSESQRHTSESPVVRSNSGRPDSQSRETEKSRAVHGSEIESGGDSTRDDDHAVSPSKRETAERPVDVPDDDDDEERRSRKESPHERVTAQAPSVESAERPDTDERELGLLEDVPTEEADDAILSAARSQSAMHREAPGPDSDENPFEDMEDTIAEVGSGTPRDADESKPPATPTAEEAPPAETDRPDETDPPDPAGDRSESKIGRSVQESDPEFYADSEPTGIDYSVQSPGSDEPSDADLPDSDAPASEVFQITTDPGATGLHLEDLLVDAPLDQDDAETEDLSPSDFEEIETSPVHDYEEVRDDFEIADASRDGLFEDEGPTNDVSADASAVDQRGRREPPAGDGSTYRPEPSTLEEVDEEPASPRPSEQRDASFGKEPPTDPNLPQANAGRDSGSQRTEPDIPGLKREPPTTERPPEQPDRRRDPQSAPPSPGLGDDDPTHERKRPQDLGTSQQSSQRTEVPDEETDPRGSTDRPDAVSGGGRAAERASGRHSGRPSGGNSPQAPNSSNRPIPPETKERRDDEPAERRRDDRQERDALSASDPRRRPAEPGPPGDENSGRVQSGQSRVRPTPASADPDDEPGNDASGEASSDRSDWISQASRAVSLPDTLNTWESLLIAAISFATVCIAVLFISGLVASLDADRLASTLERLEDARVSDTYQGWRKSYEIANSTLREGPGPVRRFFQAVGGLLPGGNPRNIQRQLARERAYAAAVVEYRFEAFGSRHSEKYADAVFGGPRVSGLAAASATYRLLARGRPVEATGLAQSMHHDYKENQRLARAYLEALIAAEHTGDVVREARDLRDNAATLSVYDRYLFARGAKFRDDASAARLLEQLVDEYSPQHLDARIDRVALLVEEDDHDEAIERAQDLLENYGDAASKHQRARLHVALGDAYRAKGQLARAEEQFRTAVDIQPTRPSIYVPLTELFIDDGRLSEASAHIRAAEAKAEITPRLQQIRATIQLLKGRLDSALSLLDSDGSGAMIAPVLRGRILLEQGDYQEARKQLNSVGSSHPRHAAAQSIELLARAGMGVDDRENALSRSRKFREQAPRNPLVLRSAARLRLQYARETTDRERRDAYLEEAAELLDAADATNAGRSLTEFYRCDLKLLQGSSEAGTHCRRGRRSNPDYLPGRIIRARLHLRQNAAREAASMLKSVRGQIGRRWDVDELYVRALVRNHQPNRAGDILDEWAATKQARSSDFRLLEGIVAFSEADYRKAVGFFDKARNAGAQTPEAKLFHAHTLTRLEKFDRAEPLVRDVTGEPGWRGGAWEIFGELRRRQNRPSDALENLRFSARHLDSEFAPAWRIAHMYAERALVWQQREGWDDERVARNLRRARDRGDSEAPDLLLVEGLYAANKSNPDLEQAVQHLQAVVDTQPYRCEAIEPLVELYRRLDESEARADVAELEQENCE